MMNIRTMAIIGGVAATGIAGAVAGTVSIVKKVKAYNRAWQEEVERVCNEALAEQEVKSVFGTASTEDMIDSMLNPENPWNQLSTKAFTLQANILYGLYTDVEQIEAEYSELRAELDELVAKNIASNVGVNEFTKKLIESAFEEIEKAMNNYKVSA